MLARVAWLGCSVASAVAWHRELAPVLGGCLLYIYMVCVVLLGVFSVRYLGGAYTTDAYDMTAPHPKAAARSFQSCFQGEGVARCIKTAMTNAGVTPDEVKGLK